MQTAVTNINPAAFTMPGVARNAQGTNGLYLTTTLALGPTLDLVPYIAADGYTVRISSTTILTEFLGYEQSTNSPTVYVEGKQETAVLPLPNIRVRSMTNNLVLRDGQTVLLGGPATSDSRVSNRRHLIILITPTIIDPAGNRIHSDDELEALPRR
jgi:type II secretory pathway component GspD/PulD (secretin)